MNKKELSKLIKEKALELGFDACGICASGYVGDEEANRFQDWIRKSYHADMQYLGKYLDKRLDTSLLVENSKSIISVALNYYPHQFQDGDAPQFAYYAYGKDYHDIVKAKLRTLLEYVQSLVPNTNGRIFCDTAPILERYWAVRAGLGFIGKNSLLIIPRMGSYFLLGELILDLELEFNKSTKLNCGTCSRCMNVCPSNAIVKPKVVDSELCISYQTIENRGNIPETIQSKMQNKFYGCDICQQLCPWNRFAKAHTTNELQPSIEFLKLDYSSLNDLSIEDYQKIFKGSAVKRAKHSGLIRNIKVLAPYYEK